MTTPVQVKKTYDGGRWINGQIGGHTWMKYAPNVTLEFEMMDEESLDDSEHYPLDLRNASFTDIMKAFRFAHENEI